MPSTILNIIIVIFSLIFLVILHEFGHFITAKCFLVKVDEFGVGFPPRIFGKKIGDTIYSLNLLPLGAFVKMPGEIGESDDEASFSKKPCWKRAIIVFAGVLSFWIIAAIIFSVLFAVGAPTSISDDDAARNPKLQISEVAAGSPAALDRLRIGDNVIAIGASAAGLMSIDKIDELQSFINTHRGEEIILNIQRGKEIFNVSVTPRPNPPPNEGSLGVSLNRIDVQTYPWWQAPWWGIQTTISLTKSIVLGYINIIVNILHKQPAGVHLSGPVGIVKIGINIINLGWNYFLIFMGNIAVYIAIFNILPIPALDGGKLVFLGIEAIKKKPISQKIEGTITNVFFGILILLMIFVTINDVISK